MIRKYRGVLVLTLVLWGIYLLFPSHLWVQAEQWRPVRGGIHFGISGIALVEHQEDGLSFLIVHDNKGKEDGRLAKVTLKGQDFPNYSPLNWPKTTALPIDLEALTRVPGNKTHRFMAASSSGRVYDLELNPQNQEVSVLKVFDLPNSPEGSNFEGFALQEIEGNVLAIWANRGENEQPAVIYWGRLNLQTDQITQQGSIAFKVPWPVENVRHISDLKVDGSGILYIVAAMDNGNDGSFASAVYTAGVFSLQNQGITFRLNPDLFPVYRYPYHKVEGIELVPGASGGVVVGTDDENLGGMIRLGG